MGGPSGVEGQIGDRMRADSLRRTRIMSMLDTTQRRLADRIEMRGDRFRRMERRVDGPPRHRMRDDGPRRRDFRDRDRFRDRDDPRGFDDGRRRMRGDDWRDDRYDDRFGSRRGRGWDDRRGPLPRRRMGDDEASLPDTLEGILLPTDTLERKQQ